RAADGAGDVARACGAAARAGVDRRCRAGPAVARPGGRRAPAGRRVKGWRLDVMLWVAAALLSGFTILREIGPHDEGLILEGAWRIAHGQWPYRDFWANYPPGQFVVLAGL